MADQPAAATGARGGVSATHPAPARLAMTVDARPGRAETATKRRGAKRAYGAVEEAPAGPGVRVTDLYRPQRRHAPIAATSGEADTMIAARRAVGVPPPLDRAKRD